MIEVLYQRDIHRVTVNGHAKSGEAGHDLVCAAASILIYTLAANVRELCTYGKKVGRAVIELNEGAAEVSFRPVRRYDSIATLVFDSICIGFDVLSQSYHENIVYTCRDRKQSTECDKL